MDHELTDEQFTAELGTAAELAVPPPTLVLHAAALRRGTQLRRRRTARTVVAGAALTAAVVAVVYTATAAGPRTVTAAMPAAQPSAAATTSAPPSPSPSPTPSPSTGEVPTSLAQQAADVTISLLPSGDTARLAAPGSGPATGSQALTTGTTGVAAAFDVSTPQGQRRLVVNVSRLGTPAVCAAVVKGSGQTCHSGPLDGGTLVVTSDPGNAKADKVPVVSYAWNAPSDGVVVSAQEWSDSGSSATWLTTAQVDALLTSSRWGQVTGRLPAPASGSSDSGTYCTKSC